MFDLITVDNCVNDISEIKFKKVQHFSELKEKMYVLVSDENLQEYRLFQVSRITSKLIRTSPITDNTAMPDTIFRKLDLTVYNQWQKGYELYEFDKKLYSKYLGELFYNLILKNFNINIKNQEKIKLLQKTIHQII